MCLCLYVKEWHILPAKVFISYLIFNICAYFNMIFNWYTARTVLNIYILACTVQVLSGRNPLFTGRTDRQDDKPWTERPWCQHVCAHRDHWPADPQFNHSAPHLFRDHKEESLQVHGWPPPSSHHCLWDFIKVCISPKYVTCSDMVEQLFGDGFLYI